HRCCYRIHRLPGFVCRHCSTSNIRIAVYLNQRTVRDHLYAVSDGAPLCCVRDPCPPEGEHRSRCVGIWIRRASVPVN
ncbi:MAG: hypothetical protein VW712_16085, partial [Paracoccaceae bacterium]